MKQTGRAGAPAARQTGSRLISDRQEHHQAADFAARRLPGFTEVSES